MNKVHRLIWSNVRNAWIVAPENANSRGKPASSPKRLASVLVSALIAQAAYAAPAPNTLPTGGQVVAGQAAISQAGSAMTIRQGSDRAILNWNSFSIGSNASVNFQQPSASAVALNRVVGADPSSIYGSLTANGQVFLVNPNGVLFGQGARVDVGGLVASTLNIRNEDFLAGNNRFTRDGSTAGVTNQGELLGKYVALLAPEVRNEGVIAATMGTAVLAAGEAVTLGLTGNALIDVQVEQASIDTLVENKHLVKADQGTVILSAQSAHTLLGQVVNSGAIEAQGLVNDGGTVRLLASSAIDHSGSITADAGTNGNGGSVILMGDLANPNSQTTVSGSISAKGGSASGDGGFIETSGTHLKVADSASIDTSATQGKAGTWLLDPVDFTIAASGGDITGTVLGNTLGGGSSVTIQTTTGTNTATNLFGTAGTNGDIFVNDSITWNAPSSLTLKAQRDIVINAPISITTGTLNLQFAQSDVVANFPAGNYFVYAPVDLTGASFTTKLGSDGVVDTYTVITDNAGLVNIGTDLTGKYVLGTSFAATTNPWVPLGNDVAGDVNIATPFTGILDGLGHAISGLTNTNSANQTGVGLFGVIGGTALVQNLGLTNVNMAGLSHVGALAGQSSGWIYNVYSTGTITGSDTAGAVNPVGGIGGLIGYNLGPVFSSYSSVNVTATTGVQATGVTTDGGIGGLVGWNAGAITDAYATGSVNGTLNVGGFAGWNVGPISNAYSTGAVTGTTNVGGFLGTFGAPVFIPLLFNTYWDTATSGQATSASDMTGGSSTALGGANPASNLQASYTGFDFTNAWINYDGVSRPMLRSMLTPFIVTADAKSKTYDGQTFAGAYTASYSMATPGAVNAAGLMFGGAAADAGSYAIAPSGVVLTNNAAKQDQHGYRIVFVDGTLTINKAAITVSSSNVTKAYDGSLIALGGAVVTSGTLYNNASNGGVLDSLSGGTFAFTNANAGTGNKTVTVSGVTVNDGNGGNNYTVTHANNTTSTINKAAITVSSSNVTKAYDGSLTALGAAVVTSGTLYNNASNGGALDSLFGGTFAFTNANAGTGNKTVTVSGVTVSDGNSGGNYTVTHANNTTSTINKAAITVSSSNVTKAYDGSLTALGAAVVTSGTLYNNASNGGALDSLFGGTFAFTNANAGVGNKTVTVSGVTVSDGNSGNNYTVTLADNTTSTINKAAITVSSSNVTKAYDGSLTALGTAVVTSGTLYNNASNGGALDSLFGGTFAFTNANAGTGNKTVTVSGVTVSDGNSGGNYTVTLADNTTSTINKAAITVSSSNVTKAFDGSLTALGTAVVTSGTLYNNASNGGALDSLFGGTFAFTNANAGTGNKTVTVSGVTVNDGNSGGNYTVSYANNTTSTISDSLTTPAQNKALETAVDIVQREYSRSTQVGTGSVAGGGTNKSNPVTDAEADEPPPGYFTDRRNYVNKIYDAVKARVDLAAMAWQLAFGGMAGGNEHEKQAVRDKLARLEKINGENKPLLAGLDEKTIGLIGSLWEPRDAVEKASKAVDESQSELAQKRTAASDARQKAEDAEKLARDAKEAAKRDPGSVEKMLAAQSADMDATMARQKSDQADTELGSAEKHVEVKKAALKAAGEQAKAAETRVVKSLFEDDEAAAQEKENAAQQKLTETQREEEAAKFQAFFSVLDSNKKSEDHKKAQSAAADFSKLDKAQQALQRAKNAVTELTNGLKNLEDEQKRYLSLKDNGHKIALIEQMDILHKMSGKKVAIPVPGFEVGFSGARIRDLRPDADWNADKLEKLSKAQLEQYLAQMKAEIQKTNPSILKNYSPAVDYDATLKTWTNAYENSLNYFKNSIEGKKSEIVEFKQRVQTATAELERVVADVNKLGHETKNSDEAKKKLADAAQAVSDATDALLKAQLQMERSIDSAKKAEETLSSIKAENAKVHAEAEAVRAEERKAAEQARIAGEQSRKESLALLQDVSEGAARYAEKTAAELEKTNAVVETTRQQKAEWEKIASDKASELTSALAQADGDEKADQEAQSAYAALDAQMKNFDSTLAILGQQQDAANAESEKASSRLEAAEEALVAVDPSALDYANFAAGMVSSASGKKMAIGAAAIAAGVIAYREATKEELIAAAKKEYEAAENAERAAKIKNNNALNEFNRVTEQRNAIVTARNEALRKADEAKVKALNSRAVADAAKQNSTNAQKNVELFSQHLGKMTKYQTELKAEASKAARNAKESQETYEKEKELYS